MDSADKGWLFQCLGQDEYDEFIRRHIIPYPFRFAGGLPEGWHLNYSDSMELILNCPEAYMSDSNLGVYRTIDTSDEEGVPEEIPEFAYYPALVAAVVEKLDITAMRNIIEKSRDQLDWDQLVELHNQEFEKASEECAFEASPQLLMQLWAGCLAAAKGISPRNYWIGPINPWMRFNLFKHSVFPNCADNAQYRLGALAAPHFKAGRREAMTLEGVPLRTCGDPDFQEWRELRPFRNGQEIRTETYLEWNKQSDSHKSSTHQREATQSLR